MGTLHHSSVSGTSVHQGGNAIHLLMVVILATVITTLCEFSHAVDVYRCDDAGKVTYTSSPAFSSSCKPVDLKVTEPNPADVSRALEEKRRKAIEDEAAEEKARQERLVRARELEAEAALRRARAAEEEARALRLRDQESGSQVIYPGWGYPILRPPIRPRPHHHPDHRPRGGQEIAPKHPVRPAPKPQAPSPGGIPHPRSR